MVMYEEDMDVKQVLLPLAAINVMSTSAVNYWHATVSVSDPGLQVGPLTLFQLHKT